ncbi:MAG: acetyl-CoA carboxylase biotin carboxyl carrier protein subunit [Paludisphaera borealis]|uniref:biotin/lipoyl-containing protein n=1 Tax=Paludisphaera borealis TaxID=1387353 RepID=UPI002841D4F8|nr:biotin/lipoyl-containing protein [Paludisphaera borealis]MDR3622026.1 acetyl-CoA carboxylase biotin carboxyl carrier protein subunit [Paludisphaera borealis]
MKLKITVDGKLYEVDVEVSEPERARPGFVAPIGHVRVPATPVAAPAAPPAGGETVADESKVCRSPFSGTVSRVEVEVGRQIAPNEVLIVLEAMKMETIITAPVAGKIAKVNVGVGDAVQQGRVLIEFE